MGPGPGVGARVAATPAPTAAHRSLSGMRSPGRAGVGAGEGPPRIVLPLPTTGTGVARLSIVLAVPSVARGVPVLLPEAAGVVVPGPPVVGIPSPLAHAHLSRGLPVALCILDLQRVPVYVVPVQLVERLLRVPHVLVLYVGEPTRLLRVVVQWDVHVSDGTVLCEYGAHLLCLDAEGEVADKQGRVGGSAVSA